MRNNMLACTRTQAATTSLSCGSWGIRATVSFITYTGQVLGVNAAALGYETLAQLLADPLGPQHGLSLKSMDIRMARGEMPEMAYDLSATDDYSV